MNDPDEFPTEPDLDMTLERLLAPLKRLEPSMEARVRNRIAVANELHRMRAADQKHRRSWWRRTLSIPVPIAAALVILAVSILFWNHRHDQERLTGPVTPPPQPSQPRPNDTGGNNTNANHLAALRKEVEYRETETYLCGVGRLESESGNFIQE